MGGTSGISILAATLLPHMDVGTFMFIINAVLVALGLVFLGIKTMGATIYSSFALSFYVWILERVYPMPAPFTSDTFLELCYAVLLPAAARAFTACWAFWQRRLWWTASLKASMCAKR